MKVRASLGTLAELGVVKSALLSRPGVAYVMQYSSNGCLATCHYCTQSRLSRTPKDFLSRIVWPSVDLKQLLEALRRSSTLRVCLQTVIKPGFVAEAHSVVRALSALGKRVSLSITPISDGEIRRFHKEGVDYVGVGLDVATPRLFKALGKPYSWETYWEFIRDSVGVLGRGRVVVHIIIGLGETVEEALNTIRDVRNVGAEPSLFAFTPVRGTPLESRRPPNVMYYRFIQIATELIMEGYEWEDFIVKRDGKYTLSTKLINDLLSYDRLRRALMTRGCPGCNRPFYNESPGREPYNFPDDSVLRMYWEGVVKEIKSLEVSGVQPFEEVGY